MHAVDLIDGEAFEQPVLDHGGGAEPALFRRLKDHDRLPSEIPGLGQIPRRAEQHRGMPVMTAGVHFAGGFGGVRQSGRLLDRKRVHVGAKPDHLDIAVAGGLASLDDADHAGPAKPGYDLVAAEFPEPLGHESRGAALLIAEFRMFMDIAAPSLDFGLQVGRAVDDGHGKLGF